jgi:hypothetical protein
MIPTRSTELALRKQMLRQRRAVLRHAFALQVNARVAPMVGLADQAVAAGRWIGRHPYWVVAVSVALAVWRPKGAARLAGRGMWMWHTWQRLQPVVVPLLLRLSSPGAGASSDSTNEQEG